MLVFLVIYLVICLVEKLILFEMIKNKIFCIIKYFKSFNLYEKIIYEL